MANNTPSNLLAAQMKYTSQFTDKELRFKQSPTLRLGLENKSVLPGYETEKKRDDRAVNVYMLSRSARSTGTGRTHNHSGNRGDSFTVTPTWSTVSDKFSISIKQLDTNVFAFEEAYGHEIYNAAINIHEQIETNAIDHLTAQRTQVVDTTASAHLAQWNSTNYAWEVATSDRARLYQAMKSVMRINKYNGLMDVISSPELYVDSEYYANQGTGNNTNTGFQYSNVNAEESIELTDANYGAGMLYCMPSKSFAVLPWIPKQNRVGQGNYFSYVGGFGSIPDPTGSGLEFAMHAYMDRADTSSANGDEQDVVLQVELSVDIAHVLSPLSTANASVVHEFALVT